MREIKFRAWNKKYNFMMIPDIISQKTNRVKCDGDWYEKNEFELMPYIGLKDKNGKEIYKGDILKGFVYPFLSLGIHNYFAEVRWFDNEKCFGLYIFKALDSKVRGLSTGNIESLEDWNCEQWEVIGNIHENTELLEVEE